jgi:3-methyladenine DNA glycosylase/8-oxoguanine DNA glycosylase
VIADAVVEVDLDGPLDIALTVRLLRMGANDPAFRIEGGRVWQATWTPEGPVTVLAQSLAADRARLSAWGPGAGWAAERASEYFGVADRPGSFDVGTHPDPAARRSLQRFVDDQPGLRLGRAFSVFQVLADVVYQQRVTWGDACNAHAVLARRFGEPAPGPVELRLPPSAAVFASLPYYELHRAGVERRRAECIQRLAKRAKRLEALREQPLAEARRLLGAFPGVGPWTVEMVLGLALGDADALPLGDYHLPNVVAWILAREERAEDARMVELLEPYRGHRWRVVRLLVHGGAHAPRFGPRMPRTTRWDER